MVPSLPRLVPPLLMPFLAWAALLAVQQRARPDPRLRLYGLVLVDPPPGGTAVAEKDGLWTMRPGRVDFRVQTVFRRPPGPPGEPAALYVPFVKRNLEVFLNGTKVGDGGRLTHPVERNRDRPLFFTLPEAGLLPGENVLEVRVVTEPDEGAILPPLHLGLRSALEGPYRWQYLFRVTALQVIVLALVLMTLFIGALWLKRRRETTYGWYAAGLFLWAVFNLGQMATWPVPLRVVLPFCDAALTLSLYCLVVFVHRFAGVRAPRVERVFLWLVGISSAGLALAVLTLDFPTQWRVTNLAYRWVPLLLAAYLLARLLAFCVRERSSSVLWLTSAAVLCLSFGLWDTLKAVGLSDPMAPGVVQYGGLVAVMVFGSILVGRFADALRESEELNVQLDGKVQEKTRELADQYERTRLLEREMVLAEERERLVRDMHDGMGGQLVSLLSLVRSGRSDPRLLDDALTECLHDLRLMIDSMDTAGQDLAVGLGMFRSRLDPRLRAVGLAVHWDTQSVPEGLSLGPEGVLQVFRILQESIQNALKHAQAKTLWIEARVDGSAGAPALAVSVRDDGVGLPAAPPGGRGLGNMRRRAQTLSATLTVEPAHPGTRVTLYVPAPR